VKKAIIAVSIAVWSVVALLVIALLITSALGKDFSIGGKSFMINFGGGNVTLLREEKLTLDGTTMLDVGATYQDIRIRVTDGNQATVRHYDYENAEPCAVSDSGGTVSVNANWRFSINLFTFNFTESPRLEIELPSSYAGNVSFVTTSGTVRAEGDAAWGDTVLQSTSGSVNTDGTLVCRDLRAKSASGSVNLNRDVTGAVVQVSSTSGSVHLKGNTKCDELSVQSTSGSVHIKKCEVAGGVRLKSTSGSINHESEIRAKEITAETMSGSVGMGSLDAEGLIHLKSTSGSVRADAVRSPEHYIRSTSGSIRIQVLTGTGEVRSTSGSVKTNF
jgi:DUF4097 and DUF4098 domain-containing protein YvlB